MYLYENNYMRNNKLRLFEVMARMDKTFKPKLNEEFYGNDRTSCFDDKIRIGTDYEVKENYDAESDSVIPDNSSLGAQIDVDGKPNDGSDGNVSSIVPDNSSVGAKTTGLDIDIEPFDNNDPHIDTDTTTLDEDVSQFADQIQQYNNLITLLNDGELYRNYEEIKSNPNQRYPFTQKTYTDLQNIANLAKKLYNSLQSLNQSGYQGYDFLNQTLSKLMYLPQFTDDANNFKNYASILTRFVTYLNSIQQTPTNIAEYDNYSYPAGADSDPRAPWNQSKDDEEPYEYEPEYEHDDDIDEAIDEYCRGMNEVDQQGGNEQSIIADILSVNEGMGDIVSKVVEYGKKGLLTAAIVLAVALSSQAQQQNKTNDIIGISHKYIDNNEQKLVYSFMVGISTELASQSMKNGGEMENSGSLIEISIYYEALRDGKQPRQLSELAASNAKTIMKHFQNADKETISKYIEIGKNLHHNTAIYENKNSKSKQRLLEVMNVVDRKPNLNERYGRSSYRRSSYDSDSGYEGYNSSSGSFRNREMNAGVEPEDREEIKKHMNDYVKVGNSFMKVNYYQPNLGPTDGHLYVKNGDNYELKK